jgi:transcriptional regulator with XRE-family HTH domain
MASDDLRFKHIGLSNDREVIFCALDNGKTYAMPVHALERGEDWNPRAKAKAADIIHDGYAAFVEFDTSVKIDFPADFVLHVCEPSYTWYKGRGRAASGVGARVREIRQARGLTLDALAAKCGIAKPNLSRLENDKVTPKVETLGAVAAALDVHPALLVAVKKPEYAWTCTRHDFDMWRLGLRWKPRMPLASVRSVDLVRVFLTRWPEHAYARKQLLKHAFHAPMHAPELPEYSLNAEKWAGELSAAKAAQARASRRNEVALKKEHVNGQG